MPPIEPLVESLGLFVVYLAYLLFAARRAMTYLHIYQQEEYDSHRFMQWMLRHRVFDKRLSIALFVIAFLWFFVPALLLLALLLVAFGAAALLENDPRKDSKKKLVMTPRARRIFFITLFLIVLMSSWVGLLHLPFLWILSVQIIPFLLMVANQALQPYENQIQKKFWNEGHAKLAELNPTVIGITGSFGKTSVKHILGHILKTQAPTLITPGSVNTPMGVTRIIREQLEENHKYFVVEMGAYGPGSIDRLCRLTPPNMGIITAIGQAHYERFKSIEAVANAKFELALAAFKKGGKVIVNDQVLEIDYPKMLLARHKADFIVCGPTSEVNDVWIERNEQTAQGLEITLRKYGTTYQLQVPLYGLHHGLNAALAFSAAVTLGIPPEHVMTALRSVPQITHRLEVKRQADGTILVDDAFNSNPKGFRAALELLPVLAKETGGRKILITPGMVELGEAHEAEHEAIGKLAGEICDIAIIVRAERIPSFVSGFERTGPLKQLVRAGSFHEASQWLEQNRKKGDVVLIENDLPDLYERVPKL